MMNMEDRRGEREKGLESVCDWEIGVGKWAEGGCENVCEGMGIHNE